MATFEVRITAPNHVGKVVTFKILKGKVPKSQVSCLQPGSSTPSACS